jgi:hypothetical protein
VHAPGTNRSRADAGGRPSVSQAGVGEHPSMSPDRIRGRDRSSSSQAEVTGPGPMPAPRRASSNWRQWVIGNRWPSPALRSDEDTPVCARVRLCHSSRRERQDVGGTSASRLSWWAKSQTSIAGGSTAPHARVLRRSRLSRRRPRRSNLAAVGDRQSV